MRFKIILGCALALVGGILALFFWDLEFFWFQAGPLGLLLAVIGVYEVGEDLWRNRGGTLRSGTGRDSHS